LIQHVTESTRGDSLLDLVITDEPGMIDSINVYGQLVTTVSTDTIRDFNKADVASIKKELRSTVWDFDSDVKVNDLWIAFSKKIEDLITKKTVEYIKFADGVEEIWAAVKAFPHGTAAP